MPARLSRLLLCSIMPLNVPLESLTPSSKFLINRQTYKPDHMQILSRFKLRQLLTLLVSGEYPIHRESDKALFSAGSGLYSGFPTTNYSLAFLDAISDQVLVRIFSCS